MHHTHNIIELEDHSKKKYQVAMTVLNQLFLPFVSYLLIAIIESLNAILYKIGGILFATAC